MQRTLLICALRFGDWTDVLGSQCARFGMNRVVAIPLSDEEQNNRQFKMSFSFDKLRFQTPFLLISDGEGNYLEHLDFIFTYKGNDIVDLQWKTYYVNLNGEKQHDWSQKKLYVRYQWQQTSDTDWFVGWAVFWFFHFLLAVTSLIYIVVDMQLRADNNSKINDNDNKEWSHRAQQFVSSPLPQQQQQSYPPSFVQPSQSVLPPPPTTQPHNDEQYQDTLYRTQMQQQELQQQEQQQQQPAALADTL